MNKKYDIEWFDVKEPPTTQLEVLILATNEAYQFNYPQLFAGHYLDKYYDTPINEFRITGVDNKVWKPVKWAYAPKTPNIMNNKVYT